MSSGKKLPGEAEVVVMEHPIYGTAYVTVEWERVGRAQWQRVVTSVEFDLFTPVAVQEELLQWCGTARASAHRDRSR